jgi:hypothetical protein
MNISSTVGVDIDFSVNTITTCCVLHSSDRLRTSKIPTIWDFYVEGNMKGGKSFSKKKKKRFRSQRLFKVALYIFHGTIQEYNGLNYEKF